MRSNDIRNERADNASPGNGKHPRVQFGIGTTLSFRCNFTRRIRQEPVQAAHQYLSIRRSAGIRTYTTERGATLVRHLHATRAIRNDCIPTWTQAARRRYRFVRNLHNPGIDRACSGESSCLKLTKSCAERATIDEQGGKIRSVGEVTVHLVYKTCCGKSARSTGSFDK